MCRPHSSAIGQPPGRLSLRRMRWVVCSAADRGDRSRDDEDSYRYNDHSLWGSDRRPNDQLINQSRFLSPGNTDDVLEEIPGDANRLRDQASATVLHHL